MKAVMESPVDIWGLWWTDDTFFPLRDLSFPFYKILLELSVKMPFCPTKGAHLIWVNTTYTVSGAIIPGRLCLKLCYPDMPSIDKSLRNNSFSYYTPANDYYVFHPFFLILWETSNSKCTIFNHFLDLTLSLFSNPVLFRYN